MLCVDGSGKKSTQRAAIERVLPAGRFEWTAECWFNPTALDLNPGQAIDLLHLRSNVTVRRSRLFGQLPGKNKLKAWSRLPDFTIPRNQNHPVLFRRAVKLVEQPPTCGQGGGNALRFPGLSIGTALARSGGDRRSRLSTNSQHLLGMASGG